MERIRNLSLYAKILLLALVVMIIVFAVVYPVTISREGYLYNDHLLIPTTENGSTVYSGKVDGQQWRITVTAEKSVTFQFGNKQYGPYTAKKDPTAIPKENGMAHAMTGVEVRVGDEILFRGGIYDTGSSWIMVNEDGSNASFSIGISTGNGTIEDGNGNIIDTMRPSVGSILRLMQGPELTHKGVGVLWFLGTFIALIAAASILFADELFQLQFIFKAQNPEMIEPSELTLMIRPIEWFIWVVMVFATYMMGLI